jgi:ABC-type transport system substrate-binding protein
VACTAIMPGTCSGTYPRRSSVSTPIGTRCPVGNGPFVFQEHRQDESWTFVRNPGFPEGWAARPTWTATSTASSPSRPRSSPSS